MIVVDDGSNDGTINILKRFGDLVRLDIGPNRGASFARNRGTQLARGEYIQYLDADDVLVQDALEKKLAALLDESADVAYTDWQKFKQIENGNYCYLEKFERDISDVDSDVEIACATEFWAPPVAILYRRCIVEKIGGWKEDLPIIQDARFLFDAAHIGAKYIRVPGIGAYYRTSNSESLSNKDEYRFVLDVMHNAIQIQDLWTKERKITIKRKEALRGIYDYTARAFVEYDEEQFKSALQKIQSLGINGTSAYVTLAGAIYKLIGIQGTRSVMKIVTKIRQMAILGEGHRAARLP